MHGRYVVVCLDCWHANRIIYQAEGRLDDGRYVYVRYRGRWFSVGVGDTPDEAAGADTFIAEFAGHDPSTINRATLQAWAGHLFDWPERIDGYANEGPPEGVADV